MKVLQLIDSLDAGGAERMAVNIANANAMAGVESYLCSTVRGGALEKMINKNVQYFILNKKSRLDYRALNLFFKYLKDTNIDIIHAHSTSIQLAVLSKIKYPKIKILWHNHFGLSTEIRGVALSKIKIFSRFIDVSIAVNQKLLIWAQDNLYTKKNFFINNFSLLSTSTSVSHLTTLKGGNGKRILLLANLRPVKNHINLMKVFKESLLKYPGWTLHFVGKDFNDDYSKLIDDFIKTEKLEGIVFCYGSRSDISNILSQSTIGVLVSNSEGLPLSLLEYGNAALPVITTNVGQCAKIVGCNGFIIDDVNAEMFQALERVFSMKPENLKIIGENFKRSLEVNYSEKAFMNKILPIYKGLIS
ncbi:glycosyltransferase [Dokdonia sp. R86516]|uniref:glycosyltransferase n=1 Tax=Dokdonia sp. R86516 TaxID=3093856 RepID=UPI0037CB1AF1